MKIWIDMVTSPQVLFLRPIIAELQKRGYELILTTRHSTETVPLADRYGFAHTVIGIHGGGTLIGKGMAIALRAVKLINFTRHHAISLAISHGSYSQALAAGWDHIPMVAFQDYEGHPANHILCRVVKRVLVPNVFSKTNLKRYGASEAKIVSYGGLKENIYLSEFIPDPLFCEKVGIPSRKIIVTMRPPNLVATYHRFKNSLFDELLYFVLSHSNTFVVLLPRGSEQYRRYEKLGFSNVLIPSHVLDGPNLIFHSDLVIGAGGTMNREATVLETPVYTAFKGMLGSVDQHLIRAGKMVRIEDRTDIPKIKVCKKPKTASFPWKEKKDLVNEVVDKMLQEVENVKKVTW